MQTILVNQFKNLLNDNEVYLLDVRTKEEFSIANIGGENIPLDELGQRYSEVPKDKNIYCLCHHGVRSMYATDFLNQMGYNNVFNIEGGIDAWSLQIDPSVPRY